MLLNPYKSTTYICQYDFTELLQINIYFLTLINLKVNLSVLPVTDFLPTS